MEGAGQTIIDNRYKRLATERRLLRTAANTAAFCTLLQAAILNGVYVFQEVMPPSSSMAACGLGLFGFVLYLIGSGRGQAHRERLWVLRLAVAVNVATIGLASINFYHDHIDGNLPTISSEASYGDMIKQFARFHPNPNEDRSLEALGSFLCILLAVVAELLRLVTVMAAVFFIKDKATTKSALKKRA